MEGRRFQVGQASRSGNQLRRSENGASLDGTARGPMRDSASRSQEVRLAEPTQPTFVAPWHKRRPDLLHAALASARNAAPLLGDLAERWLPRMPRRPLASQNIRSICRDPSSGTLPLNEAITCPWICPNTREALNALTFDIDHDDAHDCCLELRGMQAPVPDLVIDPWSGRAHAILWLAAPVRTATSARSKPQELARYAWRLLAVALRAGLMPQMGLIKNPWGCLSALIGKRLRRESKPSAQWVEYQAKSAAGSDLMWTTLPGTGPAELRDVVSHLAPGFELDATPQGRPLQFGKNRGVPNTSGRNLELFDRLRWYAYDHHQTSTENLAAEGQRINLEMFATPLPDAEVIQTAGSVGRFMRDHYRPRHTPGTGRGRDRQATAGLPGKARQGFAGRVTAHDRRAKTDCRFLAGVARLRAAGKRVTQAAVAAETGLSLRTVKSRWRQPGMVQDAVLSGNAALSRGRAS